MFFNKIEEHKIAIIIPIYNFTDYFEESLISALRQTYRNKEIIVVDDGSNTEAKKRISEICSKYEKVKLIVHEQNQGVARARAKGVESTNAEFIVFLDADDRLVKNALKILSKPLIKNDKVVVSYGSTKILNENRKTVKINNAINVKNPLEELLSGIMLFTPGGVCIRKDCLSKVIQETFDLKIGEDWVLWCNLAIEGLGFNMTPRIVLIRKKHKNNSSNLFIEDPSELERAYRRVFENERFIEKVGKEALDDFREICTSGNNLYLARKHILAGNPEKAVDFFSKQKKLRARYCMSLN